MTNSIKQGLKDGNGGNMVTGTKITVCKKPVYDHM